MQMTKSFVTLNMPKNSIIVKVTLKNKIIILWFEINQDYSELVDKEFVAIKDATVFDNSFKRYLDTVFIDNEPFHVYEVL